MPTFLVPVADLGLALAVFGLYLGAAFLLDVGCKWLTRSDCLDAEGWN
jgi:hypothetical protein